MYEFVKKVIIPVGAASILAAAVLSLCVEHGQCDYLKLWMFIGIPFGVHRMFLWIIPKGFDIGGTVGKFVFNLLIGGCDWRIHYEPGVFSLAVFYLVKTIVAGISRLVKAGVKVLRKKKNNRLRMQLSLCTRLLFSVSRQRTLRHDVRKAKI